MLHPLNYELLKPTQGVFMQKKVSMIFSLLMVMSLVLSACAMPEPVAPTQSNDDAAPSDAAESDSGDDDAMMEATQGGIWTESSSADTSILNPILGSDNASSGVYTMLFPGLLGTDPFSGEVTKDEMAEDWDVSDDGLVWTFKIREGVTWSDGEAVDANDFKFTYDAIASDLVETPRKSNVEFIDSIDVLDDYTAEVTFSQVKCDGLLDLGLGWLPSHLYANDFSDIMENDYNQAPPVSAGPVIFGEHKTDELTTLLRNETYWKGAPNIDGRVVKVIPDSGARLAQLQTGEIDFMGIEPEQIDAVEADDSLIRNNFNDDGYTYIGLNLGDPENVVPGQDEDGNMMEQAPHPILSDRAVRLAIAHSLDYESIIDSVYLGQGYQIASNVLPAVGWAHDPSIEPYEYDQAMAAQVLEDAGWVDEDGDGVREKDGMPLELDLMTNSGNTTREELGVLVQDQLAEVGFQINFEAIDFGTMVGLMLGQTYDMVIIGWTGMGTDPNDDSFWHSRNDTPESGFNFVSYSNPEIDELLDAGIGVVGCGVEERAEIYKEIQQIIHDDIPYVFVTGSVGNRGYSSDWANIDPGEWSFSWNIETWFDKTIAQ